MGGVGVGVGVLREKLFFKNCKKFDHHILNSIHPI